MADAGPKPEHVRSIEFLLKSMGVADYDPRVVQQLLDFQAGLSAELFVVSDALRRHALVPDVDEHLARAACAEVGRRHADQAPAASELAATAAAINRAPLAPSLSPIVQLPPRSLRLLNPTLPDDLATTTTTTTTTTTMTTSTTAAMRDE